MRPSGGAHLGEALEGVRRHECPQHRRQRTAGRGPVVVPPGADPGVPPHGQVLNEQHLAGGAFEYYRAVCLLHGEIMR